MNVVATEHEIVFSMACGIGSRGEGWRPGTSVNCETPQLEGHRADVAAFVRRLNGCDTPSKFATANRLWRTRR